MAEVLHAFVILIFLPGGTSKITNKESCGSMFEVQVGELETYELVFIVVSPSHYPDDDTIHDTESPAFLTFLIWTLISTSTTP